MTILHLADLHLQHEWFDWVASRATDFDLIVIAGDLQNAFSKTPMRDQSKAISHWLKSLRSPTVVCSGNHDFWAGDRRSSVDVYAEAGWINILRQRGNVIGVDGDTLSFQRLAHSEPGLRIAVNGWLRLPDYKGALDVLVTHAPPTGCACAGGAEGRDNGDPELWTAIEDNPPRLILAGHIHQPLRKWGWWPPIDPAALVLVPGCDENAEVPAHWIIDTTAKTATHSGGEMVGMLK